MTETLETPTAAAPKQVETPGGSQPMVEKFTRKPRVSVSPVARPVGAPPVIVPAARPKLVQKLTVAAKVKESEPQLRTDGPTLEEYVAAGYDPESYPPEGYAVREKVYRFAKLRGTAVKTVFPDGSFYQWHPKRTHSGGYAPTTSMETTDAKLAEKLREAAKKDNSIREAPSI